MFSNPPRCFYPIYTPNRSVRSIDCTEILLTRLIQPPASIQTPLKAESFRNIAKGLLSSRARLDDFAVVLKKLRGTDLQLDIGFLGGEGQKCFP